MAATGTLLKTLLRILFFALASLPLAGCGQKGLVCPDGATRRLRVALMWDNAPRAEVEGMTLYFYSSDLSGSNWRFDIAGRDGGTIELPPGNYRMIAVNNDLPGLAMEDTQSYDSISAAVRPSAWNDSVVSPTGMLYGGAVADIKVTFCGVSYLLPDGAVKECPHGLVRCAPDSLATIYHVTLGDVEGIGELSSATASIDGLASRLRLAPPQEPSGTCRVDFPLQIDPPSRSLTGRTSGLGSPAGAAITLTVTARRTDGKVFSKVFDVTDLVGASPWPHNVYIRIDGLKIPAGDLPDPPAGGGAFDVDVEGWQTVEIDL